MENVEIYSPRCPGDLLCLEMSLHSLHEQHPEYAVSIDCNYPEVYANHPHVSLQRRGRRVEVDYESIGRGVSFPEAYCRALGKALDLPLVLTCSHPHIYLTDEEREPYPGLPDRYGVVAAQIKDDFTIKYYPHYQAVVDQSSLPWVQIGHDVRFPRLKNAVDLVGKTSIRQLFQVVARASVGLGAITFLQHICAALSVPYVGLVGGREPVEWVSSYPNQAILTGSPCVKGGCLRSRYRELGDGTRHDRLLCFEPKRWASSCMDAITPEEILKNISCLAR